MYSSNSIGMVDFEITAKYTKWIWTGRSLGKFGTAGKQLKQFGSVPCKVDCRNPNEIYVGEITNWRVQKTHAKPRTSEVVLRINPDFHEPPLFCGGSCF